MVTKQKLIKLNDSLSANDDGEFFIGKTEIKGFDSWKYFDAFEINGMTISPEDDYGGSGNGDDFWSVIKVQEPREAATFWKIPGFYSSGYGGELEFENIFQVVPKEKTITVWVDAKNKKEN